MCCQAGCNLTRVPFTISKGHDGTTKQGWLLQVFTLTFCVGLDEPVLVVVAILLAHDKKAIMQATVTRTIVCNIVAVSTGMLQEDDRESSVLSDSANNEKKN